MNILNDTELISLFNEVFNKKKPELPETVAKDVTELLLSMPKRNTIGIEIDSYESAITGPTLATWITPLNFAYNLNQAIDALQEAESLYKLQRELLLSLLQIKHYQRALDEDLLADLLGVPTAIDGATIYPRLEDIKGEAASLNLRLTQKLYDLFEFTKAVKLGGSLLFKWDRDQMEYSGNIEGLNKIRESLRKIILEYRDIQKSTQEIIIPISLKQTKKREQFLTTRWKADGAEDDSRIFNSDLGQYSFEVNLIDYLPISSLPFHRTKRIGIQILDYTSIKNPPGGTSLELIPLWGILIEDRSNGYKLDSSANSPRQQIDDIHVVNIQGGSNNIVWCANESLINVNANRLWKIDVEKCHINNPRSEVMDIILHFHLDYNN